MSHVSMSIPQLGGVAGVRFWIEEFIGFPVAPRLAGKISPTGLYSPAKTLASSREGARWPASASSANTPGYGEYFRGRELAAV